MRPEQTGERRKPAGLVRLARLPGRARWLALALLCSATIPAVAGLIAAHGGSELARMLASRADAAQAAGILLAVVALVAFEPPRSISPLAYARQLRALLHELQSTFDADDRRRPEGKEKEDDHVSSES
jgi:hypothetical protein